MTLHTLIQIFSGKGCKRIYAKHLSANDNSKNQVYLGGSFDVLNILPFNDVQPDGSGNHSRTRFKASLDFFWLGEDGSHVPAPSAQLILYPKYPEVRLSGFLKGCTSAPNELMTSRIQDRILLLGSDNAGRLFAYVTHPESELSKDFKSRKLSESYGVFTVIPTEPLLLGSSSRDLLISAMKRITKLEWIDSKRLNGAGETVLYTAANGGGYTLEAELGIAPNGTPLPDYVGWEVKQFNVNSFAKTDSARITLMTPEPTGGMYKDNIHEFMRIFGYLDRTGRPDRLNFGGVHKYKEIQKLTGMTLLLQGYDESSGKIVDSSGSIALFTPDDRIAAEWSLSSLIKHWAQKHAFACYVPSLKRKSSVTQYRFGTQIVLCSGTSFDLFLEQLIQQHIVYDPAVKMENISTAPKIKRRNQFRTNFKYVPKLYEQSEIIDLSKTP